MFARDQLSRCCLCHMSLVKRVLSAKPDRSFAPIVPVQTFRIVLLLLVFLRKRGCKHLRVSRLFIFYDMSFVKRVPQVMPCLFGTNFQDYVFVTCPRVECARSEEGHEAVSGNAILHISRVKRVAKLLCITFWHVPTMKRVTQLLEGI